MTMKIYIRLGFLRRRLKILAVVFGVCSCLSFLSELVGDEKEDNRVSKAEERVGKGQFSEAKAVEGMSRGVEVTSGYEPGSFLRNARPGNTSHCVFRHGAPRALSLEGTVRPSPGGGPFRALYNVVEGTAGGGANVTYCTHATPELLHLAVELVERWDGPVSVAVYAPSGDAGVSLRLVELLCRCSPRMSALSLHLVFPAEAPPLPAPPQPPFAHCSAPRPPAPSARARLGLTYPVNAARNVARVAAGTAHVLVADVELLPSWRLAVGFEALWARLAGTRLGRPHHVFVVPVFEVERGLEVPVTKRQLVDLYQHGRAVYFHRWVCLHCQRFPGLQRWLHRKLHPGLQCGFHMKFVAGGCQCAVRCVPTVLCALKQAYVSGRPSSCLRPQDKPLLVVRREFPYHRWEPVFIGTGQDPLYSEALTWEGQQDKMTQMTEMCLLGYRFVILDGAFLVHVPGVKRRSDAPELWRRPHQRSNAQAYERIIEGLRHKYGTGGRCRL